MSGAMRRTRGHAGRHHNERRAIGQSSAAATRGGSPAPSVGSWARRSPGGTGGRHAAVSPGEATAATGAGRSVSAWSAAVSTDASLRHSVGGVGHERPAPSAPTPPADAEAATAADRQAVRDLDELASAVDLAARTQAQLEARVAELGALSRGFEWRTVEVRDKLLLHFERVRAQVLDALDARQVLLLRQLAKASADKQAEISACRMASADAAAGLAAECRRCRDVLGAEDDEAGDGGMPAVPQAPALTRALGRCLREAQDLPDYPDTSVDAFGVDLEGSVVEQVTEAIGREATIVGFKPDVVKKLVVDRDPTVATIDLSLRDGNRPLKVNSAMRPFLAGYQWKHSAPVDVTLRSVQVKLALAAGGSGFAIVYSKKGTRLAQGSSFPTEVLTHASTTRTIAAPGQRWYESHFSGGVRLSRGDYVLVSVRGHNTKWICADGGQDFRKFRDVPSAAPRSAKGGSMASPIAAAALQLRGTGGTGGSGGRGRFALIARRARQQMLLQQSSTRSPTAGTGAGRELGARTRSVFVKTGGGSIVTSLEADVHQVMIKLTVTYVKRPELQITPMVDPGDSEAMAREASGVGAVVGTPRSVAESAFRSPRMADLGAKLSPSPASTGRRRHASPPQVSNGSRTPLVSSRSKSGRQSQRTPR